MKHTRQSIGKDAAIALYESKWWEKRTAREMAEFQFLTDEVCMPFGKFHEALEATLGRPVYTHEFAMNWDGLAAELFEDGPSPTFEDIIEMIPPEKRIIIKS